jgi:hypothetical protein
VRPCKSFGIPNQLRSIRPQLNAIFGWTGSKMVCHYTQNADRARLARDAMSKLLNDTGTNFPAPKQKMREKPQKR